MNELDEDFNLDSILDEDEDITPNLPIQSNYGNPNQLQELEGYKNKVSNLESEISKVKELLTAGKKTNQMEVILQRYSNIDPEFKQMNMELLHANNEMQAEIMKPMYEYFDRLSKEIESTKQSITNVTNAVYGVQGNLALDKMVRQALERGFAKNRITVDHIENAKKEHFKRVDKDEAYHLKLLNINQSKSLTEAQKDKLVGQLMMENYREVVQKKVAKGKSTAADPTIKKTVEKDTTVEKLQKKVDKEAQAEPLDPDSVEAKEEKKKKMLESFKRRQDRL